MYRIVALVLTLIPAASLVVAASSETKKKSDQTARSDDQPSRMSHNRGPVFIDHSPHRDGFAALKNVTLHFLDWGGQGPLMLLIPGLGNTAHTYDDFAPHFTDRFHVVGLTLRGHGQSDKPASGYDTGTIVEDVRQFLDVLGERAVVLVGSSIGSDFITGFATRYPDRVLKLVYLEEAADAAELVELRPVRIATPEMSRQRSRAAYLSAYWLILEGEETWTPALEADLHFGQFVGPSGLVESVLSDFFGEAYVRGKAQPEHHRIKAPVLALLAHGHVWRGMPEPKRSERLAVWNRQRERHAERFHKMVPGAEVVLLEGAGHPLLIQRGPEVARIVREFVLK